MSRSRRSFLPLLVARPWLTPLALLALAMSVAAAADAGGFRLLSREGSRVELGAKILPFVLERWQASPEQLRAVKLDADAMAQGQQEEYARLMGEAGRTDLTFPYVKAEFQLGDATNVDKYLLYQDSRTSKWVEERVLRKYYTYLIEPGQSWHYGPNGELLIRLSDDIGVRSLDGAVHLLAAKLALALEKLGKKEPPVIQVVTAG